MANTILFLGLRLRAAVQSRVAMKTIFHPRHGLCIPIQILLGLKEDFCVDVLNLFESVPAFVKVSTVLEGVERQEHGDGASMIEREEKIDNQDRVSSLLIEEMNSVDGEMVALIEEGKKKMSRAQIIESEARLVFRKTWLVLALYPTNQEVRHLQDVRFNDPVHKWGYTLGLFQWLVVMGVWLSEQANRIDVIVS